MARPRNALLARHYHQLRTTRGTVLLGPASYDDGVEMDPAWFVDGCPLEPFAAVAAVAARHGFEDAESALGVLHELRRELRGEGAGGADELADLPDP